MKNTETIAHEYQKNWMPSDNIVRTALTNITKIQKDNSIIDNKDISILIHTAVAYLDLQNNYYETPEIIQIRLKNIQKNIQNGLMLTREEVLTSINDLEILLNLYQKPHRVSNDYAKSIEIIYKNFKNEKNEEIKNAVKTLYLSLHNTEIKNKEFIILEENKINENIIYASTNQETFKLISEGFWCAIPTFEENLPVVGNTLIIKESQKRIYLSVTKTEQGTPNYIIFNRYPQSYGYDVHQDNGMRDHNGVYSD